MESNVESPVFSYGVGEIMAENKHHRKSKMEDATYWKNSEAMKREQDQAVKKRKAVRAKETTAKRATREDLTEMLLQVMESDSESAIFSYGVGEIIEEIEVAEKKNHRNRSVGQ